MSRLDKKIIQCPKDGSITTIHECFTCNCCQQIRHADYRLQEDRIECDLNHTKVFVTPIDPEEKNAGVNINKV